MLRWIWLWAVHMTRAELWNWSDRLIDWWMSRMRDMQMNGCIQWVYQQTYCIKRTWWYTVVRDELSLDNHLIIKVIVLQIWLINYLKMVTLAKIDFSCVCNLQTQADYKVTSLGLSEETSRRCQFGRFQAADVEVAWWGQRSVFQSTSSGSSWSCREFLSCSCSWGVYLRGHQLLESVQISIVWTGLLTNRQIRILSVVDADAVHLCDNPG